MFWGCTLDIFRLVAHLMLTSDYPIPITRSQYITIYHGLVDDIPGFMDSPSSIRMGQH